MTRVRVERIRPGSSELVAGRSCREEAPAELIAQHIIGQCVELERLLQAWEDGAMELTVHELTGRYVRLEALEERHREPLRAAADDERIWEYTVSVARGPGFEEWFSNAIRLGEIGQEVPFAVRLMSTGRLVGSTRFLDPVPKHKRVEIGATWYSPDVWGTVVNTECKLLLLRYAFEVAGMNRVQLCTDVLNRRSQAAIAKLGATREGILRAHMVVREGRLRDSVLYSITKAEWAAVQATLETNLEAAHLPP